MPSNFSLFAALISGFIALRIVTYTRYAAQAWDGSRLILWSGVAGLPIAAASRIAVYFLAQHPLGMSLYHWFKGLAPFAYSGTIAGALILSFPLGMAAELAVRWNYSRRDPPNEPAIRKIRSDCSKMAGRLHHLLHTLCGTGRPICVCFEDGKVYVGFVTETPTLRHTEDYFAIVPVQSGARHPETKEIEWRVDYRPLLARLKAEDPVAASVSADDLKLLLPFRSVASARAFDPDLRSDSFRPMNHKPVIPSVRSHRRQ